MSSSRLALLVGLLIAGLLSALGFGAWHLLAPVNEVAAGWDDPESGTLSAGADTVEASTGAGASLDGTAPARSVVAPADDGRVRELAAEVTVLDARGLPLADAEVAAVAADARDDVKTDADGRAQVHLPPAATVSLRAQAAGHLPAGIPDHPFAQPATIRLAQAARLTVQVRDPRGQPCVDVALELRGWGTARAKTAVDGRAVLEGLRPGTYDLGLHGEQPGLARAGALAGLHLAPGDNAHVVTLAPGIAVTGRVTADGTGEPLAGAELTLRWEARVGNVHGVAAELRTVADGDGRYRFIGVPAGHVRVVASAQRHCAATHEAVVVDTSVDLRVDLALVRSATLLGSVLDHTRAPVADVEVTLGWGERDGLRFLHSTKTASDGSFALRDVAPHDGYLLAASAAGRPAGGLLVGKVTAGDERRGLQIELQRGGAVRGRVRDRAGAAIAGAQVRLVPKQGAERFARSASTDGAGEFAFDAVVGFGYRVEVAADAFAAAARDVDVKPEVALTDAGEFVLARTFQVDGVVSARGSALGLPGVRVRARLASGKGEVGGARSDDLGRFALQLPEGDYMLELAGVEVARGATARLRVPHRGIARVAVDTRLPAGTGNLAVRVLDAFTRAALPGVEIAGVDARRIGYVDGVYGLRAVPAGRIDLVFKLGGYQSVTLPNMTVAAGEERSLRDVYLQPAAKLRLVVVDERGRPFKAEQVKVQLVDLQALTAPAHLAPAATTANRGLYVYEGLAPSRFEVRVQGPNSHVPQVQALDVPVAQALDLRVQLARKPKPPKKK